MGLYRVRNYLYDVHGRCVSIICSSAGWPDPGSINESAEVDDSDAGSNQHVMREVYDDGAPPTIPHPVEQQTDANCLACHGNGMKIGERIASRMSHALLSNCTQCHIATPSLPFATARESIESEFVGVYRAGVGARAWTGAPPAIPHSTWMRQECASCHGLVARPGLRTTHIWRTNCTQCHAPSATLDQAAAGSVAAPNRTDDSFAP